MKTTTLTLLLSLSLFACAPADEVTLQPEALAASLPWQLRVQPSAPSLLVDAPDARARQAFVLRAAPRNGAPLSYEVTLVTHRDARTAAVVRDRLEERALSAPGALGKEHHLVMQRGATLVHASASCSLSQPWVDALDARLRRQLGELPMGPLRCRCGGACVVEK